MEFTVAIDGPAGAGKGTLARALAARFDFAHLDTGLLYRAVGKAALDQGRGTLNERMAVLIARALAPEDLTRADLRSAIAARAASQVAAMTEVRAALLDFQRRFARRKGGAVLDGRDIATAVCPEAEAKLFVTAAPTIRAARRHAELTASGANTTLERVLSEIEARDARDRTRSDAPLAQSPDAHLLDTSELSIDGATALAAGIVEQALARV